MIPDEKPRDLLTNPAWEAADLGLPLPPSLHAVSVALPQWQDVIDYEEEHPRIAAALKAGYPRFFLHPLVSQLFSEAERRFAAPGEGCVVFPSQRSARRAAGYAARKSPAISRVVAYGFGNLHALVFPEKERRPVREYWRYCGEVVSSRQAERALSGMPHTPDGEMAATAAKKAIRCRLAGLSGVEPNDVFLFPSGMAAMAAAHRVVTAARPGLATAQLDFPYVDVLRVQQEFGSGVAFFPVADAAALEKVTALADAGKLAAVFAEVPSNPLLKCVPVDLLSDSLRAAGVPLVLDDTVATVVNLNALAVADLVTTSLTKAYSGTGDVIAGAVTVNPRSPWHSAFRAALSKEVSDHDLFQGEDAIVLEQNSRDFVERVQRMNVGAERLTEFLQAHPGVKQVWYPGSTEDFGCMARPSGGRGCLFSFLLEDEAAASGFYDKLHLSKGPSLGTNFSLCCPYTLLAHYQELDWAADCGVPRHLLRVSAGLENPEELIRRFAAALPAG